MKEILKSIRNNKFDTFLIIVVLIFYTINNLIIKSNTQGFIHEFFKCHFNDLMAPVFMLSYTNILLGTRNLRLIKIQYIIIFILVAGCVWEFVAPHLKHGSVTDINDLVCYIIGALIYAGLVNGKKKSY